MPTVLFFTMILPMKCEEVGMNQMYPGGLGIRGSCALQMQTDGLWQLRWQE